MKKTILITVVLFLSFASFSQKTERTTYRSYPWGTSIVKYESQDSSFRTFYVLKGKKSNDRKFIRGQKVVKTNAFKGKYFYYLKKDE